MERRTRNGHVSPGRRTLHVLLTAVGAVLGTLAFFLVLPFIQSITKGSSTDLITHGIDTTSLPPPPPPPPEEEPEEEKQDEEKPPELVEETQPLDLAQLELALSPGFGDGWGTPDFNVRLDTGMAGGAEEVDKLFQLADLDQKPRVIYQPSPALDPQVRKRAPGTVHVIFIVDQNGRVQNPIVQDSSDPVFEKPALATVKQWKFEPGKRNGEPVRFRMRVPVTFTQG